MMGLGVEYAILRLVAEGPNGIMGMIERQGGGGLTGSIMGRGKAY